MGEGLRAGPRSRAEQVLVQYVRSCGIAPAEMAPILNSRYSTTLRKGGAVIQCLWRAGDRLSRAGHLDQDKHSVNYDNVDCRIA